MYYQAQCLNILKMMNIICVIISRFHTSPILGFTISRIPWPGGASLLLGDDDDPLMERR